MSYIAFEIPERFLQGMATGALERYGALIKDTRTGQIVAHLREVIPSEELNRLSQNVLSLGNRIGDIQGALKLTAAGLGAVGLISVAGFMCMAHKLESLKAAMQELGRYMEKTHREVEMLRLENAIALAKNYHRAAAAIKEEQFKEACHHARNCSADIENYLLNMPVDDILSDERKLEFLIRFLLLAMKCQIQAATQLSDIKIHFIYKRYRDLFKAIEIHLDRKLRECRTILPGSLEDLTILSNLHLPSSFTNRLMSALPACHDVLTRESLFLEMGDRNLICHGRINGKECVIAFSDACTSSAYEYADLA